MLVVNAQAIPNQTFQVQLDNQNVTLNIYQQQFGLYMDVLLNNADVVTTTICQNKNRIIRDSYFGFSGDFVWYDTQGTSDPVFTGIGTRFLLIYLEEGDLAAFEASLAA